MATTWPGSCPVFMTWPWPWIYIRAWQDLETGLKRTLTFKNSEIISTWHFHNSNNNSTISNPSGISKIPKLSSLGKSKIYFITSWLGSLLACGTGRRRPSRSSSATFSSKQFLLVWTTLKFARVSVKYNLSIFWDFVEFSWRCWVDLGCVRKGGWRGRKNKLVAQERFSVSTDIGRQGKAMQS